MLELKMILADEDVGYVDRLTQYLQNYSKVHFTVYSFSDRASLARFLKTNSVDLILTTEYFYEMLEPPGLFVLLTEGMVGGDYLSAHTLAKYQSAAVLAQKLVFLFTQNTDKGLICTDDHGCQIIGIYGAGGGVGTTTVSLALASALAQEGRRTLWLSMEENPGYGRILSRAGGELSDFLYYLHKNSRNLTMRLAGLTGRYEPYGLDYFGPPVHSQWLAGVNDDIWRKLLEWFKSGSGYDYVVIDLADGGRAGINRLIGCDTAMVLFSPDGMVIEKMKDLVQGDSRNIKHCKPMFVVNENRHPGQYSDKRTSVESLEIGLGGQLMYSRELTRNGIHGMEFIKENEFWQGIIALSKEVKVNGWGNPEYGKAEDAGTPG